MNGRARLAGAAVFAMASAAAILACSLRDTSYLQSGPTGTDSGNQPDVITNPDGGAEGGATRTSTVIASGQPGARLLIQDATSIYWVTNDGKLHALGKTGGDPRVVGDVGIAVAEIATEAASPLVFFVSGPDVKSISKTDGTIKQVGTTFPPPTGVAADAKYVFVMADNDEVGSITRFAHDGAGKAILHSTDVEFVKAMALDDDSVAWDTWGNAFASLPKESPPVPDAGPGATPTITAATGQDDETSLTPRAFAVDGTAYYFSNGSDVRKLARTNGSAKATQLITYGNSTEVNAIAVDDLHVYALETSGAGSLQRTTKDGLGTPEVMLTGLKKPTSLAVDATSVYITIETAPGEVIKCPK